MSAPITPDLEFSRHVFDKLDQHWTGLEEGMSRPGYGPEETEAILMLAKEAKALGTEIYRDLAGNHYFIYKGQDSSKPVLMMGSHLDSVPHGGRYDGPAGVVAGMTTLKYFHDHGIIPPQDICVVVWRNEESSSFNQFAIGSKLAVGNQISADILQRKRHEGDDLTLEDHMKSAGLDTDALRAVIEGGQSLLPLDRIGSFYEAHIEQGQELALTGHSIGIVTDIRGNVRVPKGIHFHGEGGHTGSVPQDKRRDAAIAASRFIFKAVKELKTLRAKGQDIVWSAPILTTGFDASTTTIADHCVVQPEVRSTNNNTLKTAKEIFLRCAKKAAKKTGTEVELVASLSAAASMHKAVQRLFRKAAQELNIKTMTMPSGAGHDAGVLAGAGVPCGMLFMAHDIEHGTSHKPSEMMGLRAGDDPVSATGSFRDAVAIFIRLAQKAISVRQETGPSFADALRQRGAQQISVA